MAVSDEKHLALATGALMPRIGLGTWKADPEKVGAAVEYALTEAGYAHIDCAAVYENEREIGSAFERIFTNGKAERRGIFVTSKLWNSAHRRDAVRPACEETLRDLALDYLDLYLMHWGIAARPPVFQSSKNNWGKDGVDLLEKVYISETWEAMQELVKAGLVKAIGVANFTVPMLIDLLSYAAIPPVVNQVELHPYLQQRRLVEFCQREGIVVTAYSPLGRPGSAAASGFPVIVDDPVIVRVAEAHGKTPAQAVLRWGVQRSTVVIPKSTHPGRIKENIGALDFVLSEDEMAALGALDRGLRLVDPYEWGKIPYFS